MWQIPCKMTNSSSKPLQTLGKWYQPRNPKKNPKPAQKKILKLFHTLFNHEFYDNIHICHFFRQITCFESSPPWHTYDDIVSDIHLEDSGSIYIWHILHICSDILSDILSCRCSDILSDILSGIHSDILSGIYSEILSGIPSGIYSDILSGIYSDSLSGIFSGINLFWHSIWHLFAHSIWHSIWHSLWHEFGSRRTPQHPGLGIWSPGLAAWLGFI